MRWPHLPTSLLLLSPNAAFAQPSIQCPNANGICWCCTRKGIATATSTRYSNSMKQVSERCWHAPAKCFARPMIMQTMHLDEERLQRAAHGELLPSEAATVRVHLERCSSCQERLQEAKREQAEVDS